MHRWMCRRTTSSRSLELQKLYTTARSWPYEALGRKILVLFLQFLIGVVKMDEFTGNFEEVGTDEFNEYVEKKNLASNMKHVRRAMMEALVSGISRPRIPTNFVKAVTLLMLQQGVNGENFADDMAEMEMSFEYFVYRYRWFLVFYGIIFFMVGMLAGQRLRGVFVQIEEYRAWMEERMMTALREADVMLFQRPVWMQPERRDMSEADQQMIMNAMRERHQDDSSHESSEPSRHNYIDDWDPFSGQMREFRILERDKTLQQ